MYVSVTAPSLCLDPTTGFHPTPAQQVQPKPTKIFKMMGGFHSTFKIQEAFHWSHGPASGAPHHGPPATREATRLHETWEAPSQFLHLFRPPTPRMLMGQNFACQGWGDSPFLAKIKDDQRLVPHLRRIHLFFQVASGVSKSMILFYSIEGRHCLHMKRDWSKSKSWWAGHCWHRTQNRCHKPSTPESSQFTSPTIMWPSWGWFMVLG